MGTRPKVDQIELARAIARIAARRRKIDDPHRELLPDAADSDPREILDYLRKHSSHPAIPSWVLQADICDALILNNWLWWQDRARELYFLKAGRRRGLFLSQLGAAVGVGKQGVIDRIDRLEALLDGHSPNEKLMRDLRRDQREKAQRLPIEQAWIDANRSELVAVINALVAQAARFELADEHREWIEEIEVDAADNDLTPATMVRLALACDELRTAPPILALNASTRPHGVHAALVRADMLRSDFAALGFRRRSTRSYTELRG